MSSLAPREHASRWLAAWNRHDLDGIVECYSEDVEFVASTVVTRWGLEDGVLRGKDMLRRHFRRGLEIAPDLSFDEEDLFTSPRGYALLYRRDDGRRVIDTVELDDSGRAARAHACYQAPGSATQGRDGAGPRRLPGSSADIEGDDGPIRRVMPANGAT